MRATVLVEVDNEDDGDKRHDILSSNLLRNFYKTHATKASLANMSKL